MLEFYRIDEENAAVRALQARLRYISKSDPRISPVFIDGIYGEETEEAVIAFQRAHGLPISGQVDFATHRAINREYQRLLKENADSYGIIDFQRLAGGVISPGDVFDGVAELQIAFRSLGEQDDRFNVPLNGIYGEETVTAVKLFQQLRGYDENGIVDIILWNELAEFAARPQEN